MKRKILIVEHDPVHQSHLARLVTRLGHEPVAFASGQEALDAIMKKRDPALVAELRIVMTERPWDCSMISIMPQPYPSLVVLLR